MTPSVDCLGAKFGAPPAEQLRDITLCEGANVWRRHLLSDIESTVVLWLMDIDWIHRTLVDTPLGHFRV